MLWHIVLVGIGLGAQAYAPIQMISHGTKGLAVLPESFPGNIRGPVTPQKLVISNAADSISPRRIPYFSARPDQTITWDDMGWCLEAEHDQRGAMARVSKCTGGAAQKWNWIPNGQGSNMLQLQDTNMCLNVRDDRDLSGSPIELMDCEHAATETWKFEDVMTGVSESNQWHVMLSLFAFAGVGVLSFSAWLLQRQRQAKGRTVTLSQGSMAVNLDQEGGVALAALSARRGVVSTLGADEDKVEEGKTSRRTSRADVSMVLGVPKVPYKAPGDQTGVWIDIYNRMYRERVIFLGSTIDDQLANQVIALLLYLDSEDSKKPINLYINSGGGSVTAGMAIYDTMQHVKCPIHTCNIGLAASMGSFLLAGGQKGKRTALKHSRTMIHQPQGGAQGQAEDIKVQAMEILRIHETIVNGYSRASGQSVEKVRQDLQRDNFMSAEEAKEYGLIDSIAGVNVEP